MVSSSAWAEEAPVEYKPRTPIKYKSKSGMTEAPPAEEKTEEAPSQEKGAEAELGPGDAQQEAITPEKPVLSEQYKKSKGFEASFEKGIESVWVEAGVLPDAPEADEYHTLHVAPYLLWKPARDLEFRAGARLDGMSQTGRVDHSELLLDFDETYVRYRMPETTLTLGTQKIVWGRVDEIPPSDRVSRIDLTRFILDDLADRRRAQLGARLEKFWGDYKLDLVWLPIFREAQMPDDDSIWNPVNRTTGRILGIAPSQIPPSLVQASRFSEDDDGSGGGGLRLTHAGGKFDYGLTLARTRQSVPYYELVAPTKFVGRYPFSNYAGFDFAFTRGDAVWRMELGYSSDNPVTTDAIEFRTVPAWDWVGGVEFFPGGRDTRINLQLAAHKLNTNLDIFDLDDYYAFGGEIETELDNGRWKIGSRFNLGLNVRDIYLNPSIRFLGWEPHEIYLAYHYFDGSSQTLGGFHEDHSFLALGWRSQF